MTSVIVLPPRLEINEFSSLFSGIVGRNRSLLTNNIILDFNQLQFITPTGVTVLANLIQWAKQSGANVSLRGYDEYNDAIRFLDDGHFFSYTLGQPIRKSAQRRSTTKPLEFISTAHSLTWLRDNLIFWITQNSGKNTPVFHELLASLKEIFQNIRDHSGMDIGSVFAQYYPHNGSLSLSISDIGVGIPGKIRNFDISYRNFTDYESIIKACEYEFTTSSSAGNAGRGLADLASIITSHYNGKVIIISDYGFVQWNGKNRRQYVADRTWLYPGTLIDIDLKVDNLPNVEETREDFEW